MKRTALGILLMILGACATGVSNDPLKSDSGPDARVADAAIDAEPHDPCDPSPCFADVSCTTLSSEEYSCGECPAGFEGDGESCTDIDGCAGDPCANSVECADVPAPGTGYLCGDCPLGTTGDGEDCVNIDACESEPCFPGVECTDQAPPSLEYTCGACPSGTEGDGETCSDINGCAGDPCFPGVTCTDVTAPGNGFTCGSCPSGYQGNGEACQLSCAATAFLGCNSAISGNNGGVGATDRVDQWACTGLGHTGAEVIYSFSPDDQGVVTISLSGMSGNLDLIVLEEDGGICNPTVGGSCVGTSTNGGTTAESLTFNAAPSKTYYIVIDSFGATVSGYSLTIQTQIANLYLNEIGLGSVDFVELANPGGCDINLGGIGVTHDPSLSEPIDFIFGTNSTIAASGVYRIVEPLGSPFLANEVDAGINIADLPNDTGWTMLCTGLCDIDNCTNVLDLVARDENTDNAEVPGYPSCITFSPLPVDVAGVTSSTASLVRTALAGIWPSFQRTDWIVGTSTRD